MKSHILLSLIGFQLAHALTFEEAMRSERDGSELKLLEYQAAITISVNGFGFQATSTVLMKSPLHTHQIVDASGTTATTISNPCYVHSGVQGSFQAANLVRVQDSVIPYLRPFYLKAGSMPEAVPEQASGTLFEIRAIDSAGSSGPVSRLFEYDAALKKLTRYLEIAGEDTTRIEVVYDSLPGPLLRYPKKTTIRLTTKDPATGMRSRSTVVDSVTRIFRVASMTDYLFLVKDGRGQWIGCQDLLPTRVRALPGRTHAAGACGSLRDPACGMVHDVLGRSKAEGIGAWRSVAGTPP